MTPVPAKTGVGICFISDVITLTKTFPGVNGLTFFFHESKVEI